MNLSGTQSTRESDARLSVKTAWPVFFHTHWVMTGTPFAVNPRLSFRVLFCRSAPVAETPQRKKQAKGRKTVNTLLAKAPEVRLPSGVPSFARLWTRSGLLMNISLYQKIELYGMS